MFGSRLVGSALFCVFSLSSIHALAEEPLALSLDDALKRAEQKSPAVVIGTSAVREAEARRVGSRVVMPVNPTLSVDARPPITQGTIGDLGYSATLDMRFDIGGAPGARYREAGHAANAATADLAMDRHRARAEAWTAYVKTRVAEARVAETQTLIAQAQRILDASKQRAAAGASGDIEESIATGDLAQLTAELSSAKRQQQIHLGELRNVLDLDGTRPLDLTTPVGDPPAPAPADELAQKALAARPELGQIRSRVALLDATDERLSKETFPRVGLYLGVDAAPVSPIFGVVGLSVELPVAQRNQGPRAVVSAAREGNLARLEIEARRVVREVQTARIAYEARRAELEVLTTTAVPAAERALTLVETGWRSGKLDVFRVASAARDVARAKGLRLDALEAAWVDRIELDRAAGGGTR